MEDALDIIKPEAAPLPETSARVKIMHPSFLVR